jgi:hypothetical protein
MQKLDTLSFALAGAIYVAFCVALVTIAALVAIPGFKPFADLLTRFYGFYGYSVSLLRVLVGAFWGFVEGFVHLVKPLRKPGAPQTVHDTRRCWLIDEMF